jgi:hypothetical protein
VKRVVVRRERGWRWGGIVVSRGRGWEVRWTMRGLRRPHWVSGRGC